jgi:putative membrane protein
MNVVANLLTGLVAVLHVGFLALEMFLWNGPVGQRVFAMTPEFSAASAVLAANQGLYNGFLAGGLVWGLLEGRRDVKIFFLMCIVIVGVFGGLSAKMSILFTQAALALLALGAVLATRERA